MKQLFFLLVFVVMWQVAGAVGASDSITLANDLYTKKQYEKALVVYKKLDSTGYVSDQLYFNQANSYYKTGDFVRAILYYEKALLLSPNDEDIKFNLDVARTNQVDKLEVIPEFVLFTWYRTFAGVFSSNVWVGLSIAIFILALVLIYLFLFAQDTSKKRMYFGIAIFLIALSVLSVHTSSVEATLINRRDAAIVITPSVTAKSSPDDAGTDLFVIHEGLKVVMIDKVAGWVKIKLSNGSIGWLKLNDVAVI